MPVAGSPIRTCCVADLVEDDPVISLPVADRRQRQPVEPALRGAHGIRLEAERLGAAGDAQQARPVARRVHELADPRQRHVLAEEARDHGRAGGAAVHLVELVDVRRPAPAPPPGGRQRLEVWNLLGELGRGLDVCRGNLVRVGCFRRQDLLGEVERDAVYPLEEVLAHGAFLDARSELGVLLEQAAEELGCQLEQAAVAGGLDARDPRLAQHE